MKAHTLLVFLLLLIGHPLHAEPIDFRIGISVKTLTDVNKADAEATVRAMADLIGEQTGIDLSVTSRIYDGLGRLQRDARSGELALMSLLVQDFIRLRDELGMQPVFVSARNNTPYERFYLVVRKEHAEKGLEGLQGGRILVCASHRNELPHIWLDTIVSEIRPGQTRSEYFREVQSTERPSQAVLPVFFKQQIDACIIQRSSYRTLTEMNPQIANETAVIAETGDMMMSVICLKSEEEMPEMAPIKERIALLHDSPTGQQLLNVFKVDRHIPFEEKFLNGTKALLDLHKQRFPHSGTHTTR